MKDVSNTIQLLEAITKCTMLNLGGFSLRVDPPFFRLDEVVLFSHAFSPKKIFGFC